MYQAIRNETSFTSSGTIPQNKKKTKKNLKNNCLQLSVLKLDFFKDVKKYQVPWLIYKISRKSKR